MKRSLHFIFLLSLLFFLAIGQTLVRAWPGAKEEARPGEEQENHDQRNQRNRFSTMDGQNISRNMPRGEFPTAQDPSFKDPAPSANNEPTGNMEGYMVYEVPNDSVRAGAAIKVAEEKFLAATHNFDNAPITKMSSEEGQQEISESSTTPNREVTGAPLPPFYPENKSQVFRDVANGLNEIQQLRNEINEEIYKESLDDLNFFIGLKALDWCSYPLPFEAEMLAASNPSDPESLKSKTLIPNKNHFPILTKHEVPGKGTIVTEFIIPPIILSNLTITRNGDTKTSNLSPAELSAIPAEDRRAIRESLQRILKNCYANHPESLTQIDNFFSPPPLELPTRTLKELPKHQLKIINDSQRTLTKYCKKPEDLKKIEDFFSFINEAEIDDNQSSKNSTPNDDKLISAYDLALFLGSLAPSLEEITSDFKERLAAKEAKSSSNTNHLSAEELLALEEVLSVSEPEIKERITVLNEHATKILSEIPSEQRELLRTMFHAADATARVGLSGVITVAAGASGIPLMPAWALFEAARLCAGSSPSLLYTDAAVTGALTLIISGTATALISPFTSIFPPNGGLGDALSLGFSIGLITSVFTTSAHYAAVTGGRASWNLLRPDIPYEKAQEAFRSFSKACEDQLGNTLTQLKEFQTLNEIHFQKIESVLHTIEEKRTLEKAPSSEIIPDLTGALKGEPVTRDPKEQINNNSLSPLSPITKEPLTFSKIKETLLHHIENQRKIYAIIIADIKMQIKKENKKEKSISASMNYDKRPRPLP